MGFCVKYLDREVECTLSKFAGNSKLGGEIGCLKGRGAVQREIFKRLECCKIINHINLTRTCLSLYLGECNPKRMYRLGNQILECSRVERDIGVLAYGYSNESQQCALAAKGPTISWSTSSAV